MLNQLTLRNRIFIISSVLIIFSFALIWIFVRPKYKEQIISERSTIVAQLQEYSLQETEYTIRNWLNTSNYVAEEIIQSPAEVESLIRRTIGLTPRLMRVLLTETSSGEEIDVNRSVYNWVSYPEEFGEWDNSKLDPRINVVWIPDSTQSIDFFVTQRPVQVGENILLLSLFFDAKKLSENLSSLPLDGSYRVNVVRSNGVSVFGDPLLKDNRSLLNQSLSETQIIDFEGKNWYSYSAEFQSIQLVHIIGIDEAVILEPVRNLVFYTLATGAGILLLMLVFSHYISIRINKPIAELINEVESMSKLDFETPIHKPALPEFGLMQETLENIRITLRRYQKLNVEKIIIEEWKNRYMMTYSEDLIGILDQDRKFTFTNNHLVTFLENLELNPKLVNLDGMLNHPMIKKSKSNQLVYYPEPFTVKIVQAELSHQIDAETTYYYDFQHLTIEDEEKQEQGSLFILHDKTEERILDQKRNEMINIIVHELKNPVTGVVGLSSLIMENPEIEEHEKQILVKEINVSGKRMNELVNRFLDVQRLESGRVEIEKKPVDLKQIAVDVRRISKALLNQKSLELKIYAVEEDYTVMGSSDLIFDAVQNLVSNAIKYGDTERSIELTLTKNDDKISISCTDYGYGLSVEDQQKVFDKFFRVKSNPKLAKEKGTGLGLAYVKEIMIRHNGDVALESSEEIGCRFTLIFPEIVEKEVEV